MGPASQRHPSFLASAGDKRIDFNWLNRTRTIIAIEFTLSRKLLKRQDLFPWAEWIEKLCAAQHAIWSAASDDGLSPRPLR
jgi:hypothetical protein